MTLQKGDGDRQVMISTRAGMSRLLLVTQYYHPEVGAAQTRLRETVVGLGKRGFRVRVVAPDPSYPLGRVSGRISLVAPRRERIDGVPVARVPPSPSPRGWMRAA